MITNSLEETYKVASDFVSNIKPRSEATVVGLHGDLGSGKTSFTQGVAKAMGVSDEITSPTFVIEKIYKLEDRKFKRLIHIDAYRLEEGKELEVLGFKDLITDNSNLIFIEWPENVESILPKDMIKIDFKFLDKEKREININT